jgi:hypothetical protein
VVILLLGVECRELLTRLVVVYERVHASDASVCPTCPDLMGKTQLSSVMIDALAVLTTTPNRLDYLLRIVSREY